MNEVKIIARINFFCKSFSYWLRHTSHLMKLFYLIFLITIAAIVHL